MTPLGVAVLKDCVSTAEVLLAGVPMRTAKISDSRMTALHFAAAYKKPAFIPTLIEAGADIESTATGEWTPLVCAASFGSCAAMLPLLRLGANVHTTAANGWNPLHAVCLVGDADAADLLLRWGADETAVQNGGMSPSQMILDIAQAAEQRHPTRERLTKLLAHAPQDRAWRQQGFVVMCRAHPGRFLLAVETPDTVEAATQQPQERPSRRAGGGRYRLRCKWVVHAEGVQAAAAAATCVLIGGLEARASTAVSMAWRPGSWRWPMKACSTTSWDSCSAKRASAVCGLVLSTLI